MSDHIDYAELDKAVGEAMRARPAAPAKTRPTAPPRPRGKYMDFVQRAHAATTATPASRPSLTASIQKRQQLARPTRPSQAKPASRPPSPAQRPAQTAKRPTLQAKHPTQPAPRPAPTPKPTPKKSAADSPNANNYSLGVRSPFMTSTKVAKRPLGQNIPETNADNLRSTKNVYSQKSPSKTSRRKKHTITEPPKSHSGWLWTLIVLLVIAAGGGLGYLAYLLVFANQF